MPAPSEFISLTTGGVSLSGFVSAGDLRRIDSGHACVVVIHEAEGDGWPLGRLVGSFSGGELTLHAPVWRDLPQPGWAGQPGA
ncbi:hypothetical protein [Deinococcus budaensis]|uniref:Uncharacterized protein n=1 Tax=Deinococcus budaensis TaxID=1665626 RepID=A0A7W8LPC4_9DEIO|nr:hypothetical protein [Deinococcus budaensis]MBB5233482.1 hypothetical protein [Deinococcus budaensis]